MAKRTKQSQVMVDTVNYYLKHNKVIDSNDIVCMIMMGQLLNAKCYNGFNWFYELCDGTHALVGSGDPEVIKSKNGFIQFY